MASSRQHTAPAWQDWERHARTLLPYCSVLMQQSESATRKPSPRIQPIGCCQLRDVDFSSAKGLKRKLDESISHPSSACELPKPLPNVAKILPPTPDELHTLFQDLCATGTKPVLLATLEPFSDAYVPTTSTDKFPKILTELRDEECLDKSLSELQEMCDGMTVEVSVEQAKEVELATRTQSKSKLWYRFRAGRITASKAKSACNTDPSKPSQSLVKAIGYPDSCKFSTVATRWGLEHEVTARARFQQEMSRYHDNFEIKDTGFVINPDFPHLGASPDGVVSCDCCGKFCLEIKCPYSKRDQTFNSCVNDPKFFLRKVKDGVNLLKRDHAHYYQVQTQLGVLQMETCFFVVWTECDMHVERITFYVNLWEHICDRSLVLFKTAVLPELVGKFYTRLPAVSTIKPSTSSMASSSAAVNTEDESMAVDSE